MKEHPILFNAAMVRAILSGRKTQTRRPMKPQPVPFRTGPNNTGPECEVTAVTLKGEKPRLALGRVITAQKVAPWAVGDRLRVREAWSPPYYSAGLRPSELPTGGVPVWYWADGNPADGDWTKPKPSIHMPRWASRITLEVTDVRVQRAQDISEEDARAEGLATLSKDGCLWKYGMPDRDGLPGRDDGGWPWAHWSADFRIAYSRLWDGIYGEDAWAANPWVVATTFRRVQP